MATMFLLHFKSNPEVNNKSIQCESDSVYKKQPWAQFHQALSKQCVHVLTILSTTKNDKQLETLLALVSEFSFYIL